MIRNDGELKEWLRDFCSADERTTSILMRHREEWIRLPCSEKRAFRSIVAEEADGTYKIRKIHNLGRKSTEEVVGNARKRYEGAKVETWSSREGMR